MNSNCNNSLPKGVEVPSFPAQFKITLFLAIFFFIPGLYFKNFFTLSVFASVICIGIISYNKEFKTIYYTRRAISKYKCEKYKDCFNLCKKALKLTDNYSYAFLLMSSSTKKGKF